MSEVLKNIELIEQYFEGKLSEGDRLAFETKLLTDFELKKEFDLYKSIVAGIKEAGTEKLKEKLKLVDKDLDHETKLISINWRNNRTTLYWIAASLVLLIGLSVFWMTLGKNNLSYVADKYYIRDKGLPVEMSINSNKLDEAMNKYKTSDYRGSKLMLEGLISTNEDSDTLNFYLGIVHYELGEFDLARRRLETIKESRGFREKSEFYLVLVYLKLEDKHRATAEIEQITANPNHVFFQQVQQISKELSPGK